MGESLELRASARKIEQPARALGIHGAGFFNRQGEADVGGAMDDLRDGTTQAIEIDVKPEVARNDDDTGDGPRGSGQDGDATPGLGGLEQRKPLASHQTGCSG